MSERVEQFGSVTLMLADARIEIPTLASDYVVVTDPPYGIGYAISARSWNNEGLTALKPFKMAKRAGIVGDQTPFDPTPLLRFSKLAIFGANHMAGLPTGGKWIVWDKRRDSKPDDHSDCELVWTNVKGANRIHRQKWRGIVREGEENTARSKKLHPNQKPIALLNFIFDEIHLQPTDTLLDPFMGSGSTLVAALRRGNRALGIEIDPQHFDTACRRLEAEALAREAA